MSTGKRCDECGKEYGDPRKWYAASLVFLGHPDLCPHCKIAKTEVTT